MTLLISSIIQVELQADPHVEWGLKPAAACVTSK